MELVKVARKDGEKELPKEGFKGEVERHLTEKKRSLGTFSISRFTKVSYRSSRKPLNRFKLNLPGRTLALSCHLSEMAISSYICNS